MMNMAQYGTVHLVLGPTGTGSNRSSQAFLEGFPQRAYSIDKGLPRKKLVSVSSVDHDSIRNSSRPSPKDLQTLLLLVAYGHTFLAILSTIQWSTVGTTYVAMAFTVWEWLSGFAILLIGSLRTSSIEYDRTRRLLPAGRIIVRFFQVITAIAAALGFAAMMNGIYSIIKILSPEVTDFLMSKSIGNEHVVVTVWFTVIGALNVAFGGIAALLHSYFAVRLNSVLK